MTVIEAMVLGLIQGLTEFLPVSSSGHLVLGQHWFGLTEPMLVFDIGVHVGTLVAVIVYFFPDLTAMVHTVARRLIGQSPDSIEGRAHLHMAVMIVIGSVPTAVIGLVFKDMAEELFSSLTIVGAALCTTAALLWATRWIRQSTDTGVPLSWPRSVVVGIVQGLAIVPGISRSGATICTGLYLGLDRETAARFSFLLSIPAVAGAGLLGLRKAMAEPTFSITPMLIGMAVAAITGYLALKLLVLMVKKGQMHYFAPYCLIVGSITLVAGLT